MRTMNRFDLVGAVQRIREAKNEMIKVAIIFDMDDKFRAEVDKLQTQINLSNEMIDLIDSKIVELDFPKANK